MYRTELAEEYVLPALDLVQFIDEKTYGLIFGYKIGLKI